jgi:hypothetical protein
VKLVHNSLLYSLKFHTVLGEKESLQAALESAESQLEATEAKVNAAHAETLAAKQETERRVAEKEDEFQSTRANHARALESMQVGFMTGRSGFIIGIS